MYTTCVELLSNQKLVLLAHAEFFPLVLQDLRITKHFFTISSVVAISKLFQTSWSKVPSNFAD